MRHGNGLVAASDRRRRTRPRAAADRPAIDAEEAERIGIVIEVVDDGTVVDAARAKARQVMENSPWGVALTKETMWSDLEIPALHAAVDFENRTQVMTTTTDDSREAALAFVERRRPAFRYR